MKCLLNKTVLIFFIAPSQVHYIDDLMVVSFEVIPDGVTDLAAQLDYLKRKVLEVFRNKILAACQPISLAKRSKCRNLGIQKQGSLQTILVEQILFFFEITSLEIRITSTLRYFARLAGWQNFISKNL